MYNSPFTHTHTLSLFLSLALAVLLMFEELEYGVTEGEFVDMRVLLTNPIDSIQFQIEVIGGNALGIYIYVCWIHSLI